jgi:predicted AAA+ superfamily ATPase
MIQRWLKRRLEDRLRHSSAVVLLGPRQVGKTTLALEAAGEDALYLDLESDRDLTKLREPELYLPTHFDRLVILDEVHRAPGLFPVLRGLIDQARRDGRKRGLYLLLGSASLDLLRQSGETLAGRVSYLELTPFIVPEVDPTPDAADRLWLRGGFPESYLAGTEEQSLQWRHDFVRTYLERDVPQFGPRIAAAALRRFWTMLAHHQGGLLNVAQFARNLGVDVKTAGGYIDLLADLLLVRRLPAWHANIGKRLVRSPKVYVRDSGIVHALLSIGELETLLSHPVLGASWEGFVIETLMAVAPPTAEGYFYRTSGGAEIDLLVSWPDSRPWAIEVKRSLRPRPSRGFHSACQDVDAAHRFVVYPGRERFPLGETTEAISITALVDELSSRDT